MNHLIGKNKTTPSYVLKLSYAMIVFYKKAHNEVFVHDSLPFAGSSSVQLLRRLWWVFTAGRHTMGSWDILLRMTRLIASVSRDYLAFPGKRKPALLRILEFLLV